MVLITDGVKVEQAAVPKAERARNIAAVFVAICSALFAVFVAWEVHTISGLLLASLFALFAMALAIPVQFQKATLLIIPLIPDAVVGGHRRTDPPLPPTTPTSPTPPTTPHV